MTAVLEPLAQTLIGLIGMEATLIAGRSSALNLETAGQAQNADLEVWEHHIEATIESNVNISGTDREALIVERLNGENGLLLTPTIDHLFDRGFISFDNSGELIVSPVSHAPSLNRMGIPMDRVINVGTFTDGQKHFLEYHRDSVLLRVAR